MIWTKAFWKGAGERAIKTFFQTAVALVGTSVLVQEVNWEVVLSGSALATLLSIATSVGNSDFTAGVTNPAIGARVSPPDGLWPASGTDSRIR